MINILLRRWNQTVLFKNQFGFRPNKSTDQAIGNVTKMVYTVLE